jgi:hypothetical protein
VDGRVRYLTHVIAIPYQWYAAIPPYFDYLGLLVNDSVRFSDRAIVELLRPIRLSSTPTTLCHPLYSSADVMLPNGNQQIVSLPYINSGSDGEGNVSMSYYINHALQFGRWSFMTPSQRLADIK